MSELKLFNEYNAEEKAMAENPFYMNVVSAMVPIVQTEISKAFKPAVWGNLIEKINECIEGDTSGVFLKDLEEEGPGVQLFTLTAKFSPGDEKVLHVARTAMAIKRNEKGEIIAKGQLLVDITAQSVTKTTAQELTVFSNKDMMAKYRNRGETVLEKVSMSLIDLRSLDLVYKHLLLSVRDFVVRVDGEEVQSPFYIHENNNERNVVVSMKKLDSKTSEAAVTLTAGFEAGTDEALLTSNFFGTCTTSTNDESGNMQFMHITSNVQHILSARA